MNSNWDEISRIYNIIALGSLGQKQKAIDQLDNISYESSDTDYASDHKFYETISLTMNFQARSFTEVLMTEWISKCKCDGLLFQTIFNMHFIGQAFSIEKTLAVFTKKPEIITNLPLSHTLLLFGTNEGQELSTLYNSLDIEIAKGGVNDLSKSLVETWMIASGLGSNEEAGSIFERLDRLQANSERITKPKDLVVLILTMRGIMSILPKNHQVYQQLLFVHNDLKSRIAPGDHTKLLGQFELAG